MSGEFFAVGRPQLIAACELGMNPVVTLLVMARGTQRDNCTTNWSALSVHKYSGISRRRAQAAINQLERGGLVEILNKTPRPKYKLQKPDDAAELIWLPNTLVDGAGSEVPPLTKLREFGSLTVLEKFILLYHEQDLESDGGIPRTFARVRFVRTHIADIGRLTLYGFNPEQRSANACGLFSEFEGDEDDDGNRGAWIILRPLMQLGLIREAFYMAESSEHDSERLYPVNDETEAAIQNLWEWMRDRELYEYLKHRESFEHYGVALKHVRNATLVGCYQLHYRPQTAKTSRWWRRDREATETLVKTIENICW